MPFCPPSPFFPQLRTTPEGRPVSLPAASRNTLPEAPVPRRPKPAAETGDSARLPPKMPAPPVPRPFRQHEGRTPTACRTESRTPCCAAPMPGTRRPDSLPFCPPSPFFPQLRTTPEGRPVSLPAASRNTLPEAPVPRRPKPAAETGDSARLPPKMPAPPVPRPFRQHEGRTPTALSLSSSSSLPPTPLFCLAKQRSATAAGCDSTRPH